MLYKKIGSHHLINMTYTDKFSNLFQEKFAKDSPAPSQIVQKIDMKCLEARQPQRIRAPR